MTRSRMFFLGFVALALSLLTTVFVYRQLALRFEPSMEEAQTLVVAAERVPLGARLEADHLKTIPWPKGATMAGSFSSPQEVIGRGVIMPLLENEPVLEQKLARPEAGVGLTTVIPDGMRAISVKVNDIIGVAGFVLPGTRVDVIVTGSPGSGHSNEVSKMVLENVQVLASGKNLEQDHDGTPMDVQVVTLLVTPEDAQKLALATVDANIQLALRNPLDLELTDPAPVLRASLYQRSSATASAVPNPAPARRAPARPAPVQAAAPPPEPPKPHVFHVELIQGTQRERLSFEAKP